MDSKILVLNADYQPINMTSFKKGYKLIYKKKAEVIISDESDKLFDLTREVFRPKVIRLLNYIYLPYRRLNLSKHNILKRDDHKCVYCGSKNELTLDHVFPKSRGGKNTWENLVACCTKCNSKKNDRTPEEAGMTMLSKPFAPSFSKLIGVTREEIFQLAYSN
jgi:hypothetical protein